MIVNAVDNATVLLRRILPLSACALALLLASGTCNPVAGASVKGVVTVLDQDGQPTTPHAPVVVFLDALEHPPTSPTPGRSEIRQAGKRFSPAVLPILVGGSVDFPNDDVIYHNVFSLSRAKPFDLGIYEQDSTRSVVFNSTGLVSVFCNLHPEMVSYILVLANPYFTTTDPQGRFVIEDTPQGRATVRTWYPRTQTHPEVEILIGDSDITNLNLHVVETLDFQIREENISVKHKNKWGQDYKSKY